MIWNMLFAVITPLLRTATCSSGFLTVADAHEKPVFESQPNSSEVALPFRWTSGADLVNNEAVTSTVVPQNDPRDWLFHVYTTECDAPVNFDIKQDSILGRLTVPIVSIACAVIALFGSRVGLGPPPASASTTPEGVAPTDEGNRHSPDSARKPRLYHLDYARITAVMCVIFEHTGGMGYTRRNVGWGLWWAMPFLIMTTGIGRVMSKSSPAAYLKRLSALLVVGVAFNFCSCVIMDRDWQNDPGDVVFQMFYVIFIMVLYIVSIPLSQQLRPEVFSPGARCNAHSIATCIFGAVAVAANFCVLFNIPLNLFGTLSSEWAKYYREFSSHLPLFLAELSGGWFLVSLACIMRSRCVDTGLIGWILLAYIFVPTVFSPMHQQCYAVWGNLYLFAMVTHVWKMKGSDAIARCTQAYWPLLFMLLCLLAMPDMTGRCDMFPPGHAWERFRHSAGQCLLAVIFVAGGFKIEDDPHGVTSWLGWWSLFAYISHVACFRVVGSPYAAILIFLLMVPFYAHHSKNRCKCRRAVATDSD